MRLDGASSQNLRFWGLGSGLDVDDIVSKLIQADRQPLERLQQQRQLLLWQQEEYRALNLKMRELSDAALAIRLQVNFASMTAHSSHGDVIGVSALPAAPSATYTLSVEQLADSLHLFSKSVTAGATLAEQFEGLDETVSFRIERLDEDGNVVAEHGFVFSAETDSLHDVVKRINALSEELDLEAFYDADLGVSSFQDVVRAARRGIGWSTQRGICCPSICSFITTTIRVRSDKRQVKTSSCEAATPYSLSTERADCGRRAIR